VFPNDEHVYLHGTPSPALFDRSRRDLSHGCVRVEEPVALAEWVLGREGQWNRGRIISAMQGPAPSRVDLSAPIPVVLFYSTALVWPDGGLVHFAPDIYRHDETLDRALGRRAAAR
jgi:murein L,D-transpeptidase YcbB/YkuD